MFKKLLAITSLFTAITTANAQTEVSTEGKVLHFLNPVNLQLDEEDKNQPIFTCVAKLDTGAKTSSIHATNIRYNRELQRVTFVFEGQEFTKFVTREARIKQKNGAPPEIRPVITLDLEIDGVTIENSEFTLADRSNFSTAILIGRSILGPHQIITAIEENSPYKTGEPCDINYSGENHTTADNSYAPM